jgi:hypothetical protein
MFLRTLVWNFVPFLPRCKQSSFVPRYLQNCLTPLFIIYVYIYALEWNFLQGYMDTYLRIWSVSLSHSYVHNNVPKIGWAHWSRLCRIEKWAGTQKNVKMQFVLFFDICLPEIHCIQCSVTNNSMHAGKGLKTCRLFSCRRFWTRDFQFCNVFTYKKNSVAMQQ